MKLAGGQSLYHKGQPLCDLDDITGNRPSVNRYLGRSISVPFAEPNLYALGWVNFLCHAYEAFGASPQHFAGSPHHARTQGAARGIGISGFGA
jgi:DNA polymerase/3'-5' exonuclease PolX